MKFTGLILIALFSTVAFGANITLKGDIAGKLFKTMGNAGAKLDENSDGPTASFSNLLCTSRSDLQNRTYLTRCQFTTDGKLREIEDKPSSYRFAGALDQVIKEAIFPIIQINSTFLKSASCTMASLPYCYLVTE